MSPSRPIRGIRLLRPALFFAVLVSEGAATAVGVADTTGATIVVVGADTEVDINLSAADDDERAQLTGIGTTVVWSSAAALAVGASCSVAV